MYCKNCGHQIDDNAYLCIHCGVRVQDKPSGKDEPARFCSHCGKQIDPHAYICVHCGERTGYTGQNNGSAFAQVKSVPKSSPVAHGRGQDVLAILAMIFTLIGLRLVGAVMAIVGMTLSIARHDKKGVKTNAIAIAINVAMCLVMILVYVLG